MVKHYNYKEEKFISFEKVKELWAANTNPVVVYLNNPFCKGVNGKNCKFCVHRGIVGQKKEDVMDFYFNYMPEQFKKYEDIINQNDIKLVAFGGGTPNYLSAEDFDKYLNLLPEKLKALPKQIELHAAYITKEYLDVLKKHNFKIVTFCIQTFNEEILKEWNRLPPKKDIMELLKYAKSIGLGLAIDLITYWNKSLKDFEILAEDLAKIQDINPEEITISVLYQNKGDCDKQQIYANIVLAFYYAFPDYEYTEADITNTAPTRFFRRDNNEEFKELYDLYTCSLTAIGWKVDYKTSCLGIGCYKNQIHDVYSMIGGYKTIYEIYDGKEQKYYLAKDYNFWDEVIKLVNKLRKEVGEEVPIGSEFVVKNFIKNTGYFFGNFEQGYLDWDIKSSEDWLEKVLPKIQEEHTRKDFDCLEN